MFWPTTHTMSQFNRMFDDMNRHLGASARTSATFPKVNLYSNEDGVILTAELPGIDPDDVELTIKENTVTVAGSTPQREAEEGERYHRNERRHGRFSREFTLPFRIAAEDVKAESKDGVLTLHLPKVEDEKPRKITVKVA